MKIDLNKDEVEYLLEMLPVRIEGATRRLNKGILRDKAKRNPVSTASKSEIKEGALQSSVDFIIAGVARNAKAT